MQIFFVHLNFQLIICSVIVSLVCNNAHFIGQHCLSSRRALLVDFLKLCWCFCLKIALSFSFGPFNGVAWCITWGSQDNLAEGLRWEMHSPPLTCCPLKFQIETSKLNVSCVFFFIIIILVPFSVAPSDTQRNERAAAEPLFPLTTVSAPHFLLTQSIFMWGVSIRALRPGTRLPSRLYVSERLSNLCLLLPSRAPQVASSPSLWLKRDIEHVCATHREAHYNAPACCWKWPWPGAVIQNVLNEGPPSPLVCPRCPGLD